MKLKRNFYVQPAKGFDIDSQGRSDEQLAEYEGKVGFKLPRAYCALMRQQNGGGVRYEKIAGQKDFTFYGGFSQMRPDLDYYITNFRDYILMTCEEEALVSTQKSLAPFYPERLVLFSGLDGHSAAYFDYGYRKEQALENPSIVFISDDGDEFLHFAEIGPKFPCFEDFFDSLGIDTESDDAAYLGIVSANTYDETMQVLAKHLDLNLKSYVNDDRYGQYNFDTWHSAHVPLELDEETVALCAKENGTTIERMQNWAVSEGKTRLIYTIFSPNQHRSSTYLYQDNPELTVVLEIKKSWFPMHNPIEGLCKKLLKIPGISSLMRLP